MDDTFRRLERSWVRSEAGSSIHVTGPTDTSPYHFQYPSGYDSRCGWCYLNAPHSEAAHLQKIGA